MYRNVYDWIILIAYLFFIQSMMRTAKKDHKSIVVKFFFIDPLIF